MDLIVKKNIKIRNNTNLSKPITEYRIKKLIWDLDTRIIRLDVEYYHNDIHIFNKEYSFEGDEEVDVNKLIEQVKKLHE